MGQPPKFQKREPEKIRLDRWARLMATAWCHEKFLDLNPIAVALWAMALSWTVHLRADGDVPALALRQILPSVPLSTKKAAASQLVNRGLWVTKGSGYAFRNFTGYNLTSAELDEMREFHRGRAATGAASRWHHDASSISPSIATGEESDASSNAQVQVQVQVQDHNNGDRSTVPECFGCGKPIKGHPRPLCPIRGKKEADLSLRGSRRTL